MNSLISINHKFMSISPRDLINLIIEKKSIKGVEVYIDVYNEKELKYLDDLVFELKKNHMILQIHGDIEIDCNKQIEYLKKVEEYADYLDMPIVFTLHTIYDENKDVSLEKTVNYIIELLKNIDHDKVIISLENLNSVRGATRLSKEDIKTTILNDEKLFFTYDIGHDLADYGKIINIDDYLIEDIRNIHIHSNNNKEMDHMPIYENDIHWNEIMKGLTFLIVHKYKYNIVYEYALEYCQGDTVEDKVKDYLSSIEFVSERYSTI